ncbi:MAG: hypothetical protein ACOY3P_09650 [Planctomycetota bacterium]
MRRAFCITWAAWALLAALAAAEPWASAPGGAGAGSQWSGRPPGTFGLEASQGGGSAPNSVLVRTGGQGPPAADPFNQVPPLSPGNPFAAPAATPLANPAPAASALPSASGVASPAVPGSTHAMVPGSPQPNQPGSILPPASHGVPATVTAPEVNRFGELAAPPEPVATRQSLFAVPFQIPAAGDPTREPVEVQLYVSGDQGNTWQMYARTEPQRQQFLFRAACDGDYWFHVKTVDRMGVARPAGRPRPEMRVVVDTQPPRLTLSAERGEAGQIIARWKIDEALPKPDSLYIQYRVGNEGPWQTVALERSSPAALAAEGAVNWWPHAASGDIQVRAEVSDAAGNPAVTHAQVAMAAADLSNGGFAPGGALGGAANDTLSGSALPPTDATGRLGQPAAIPWPADTTTSGLPSTAPPLPSVVGPQYADAPLSNAHIPAGPSARQPLSTEAGSGAAATSSGWQRSELPPQNVDATTRAYGAPPEQPAAISAVVSNSVGSPTGAVASATRWVTTRSFEIHYDVGDSSSAVQGVELWVTSDGARTWMLTASDDDCTSPVLATVPVDGLYGFRVVVRDASGPGANGPAPGTPPDVWIGVDTTPPAVRLLSALAGSGAEAGCLVLSWQAEDGGVLAPRPVQLTYSDSPAGPWKPLAASLDPSGRHAWRLTGAEPLYIYVRAEARDLAGNTGSSELTRPISLERIRAASESSRTLRVGDRRSEPRRYQFY